MVDFGRVVGVLKIIPDGDVFVLNVLLKGDLEDRGGVEFLFESVRENLFSQQLLPSIGASQVERTDVRER